MGRWTPIALIATFSGLAIASGISAIHNAKAQNTWQTEILNELKLIRENTKNK